MKLRFIFLSGALIHRAAQAHDGHGFQMLSHWHASDALGFLAVVAVVAAAWSYFNRK
jgi:hypothetical protein